MIVNVAWPYPEPPPLGAPVTRNGQQIGLVTELIEHLGDGSPVRYEVVIDVDAIPALLAGREVSLDG